MLKKAKTIDGQITMSPPQVQEKLRTLRKFLKSKAPEAEETISYGIPTFKLNGQPLIYFSGYKNHISVYPAPRGEKDFKKELSKYKGGKGTVQFPNDKPIPYDLVERIIEFHLKRLKVK